MFTSKQKDTQYSRQESHAGQRFFGILFGLIEVILAFRLVFKLLGANPVNAFVRGLYWVSQFLTHFFEGIFPQAATGGAGSIRVLEPATLIAMAIVGILAWVILKLLTPRSRTRTVRTKHMEQENPK